MQRRSVPGGGHNGRVSAPCSGPRLLCSSAGLAPIPSCGVMPGAGVGGPAAACACRSCKEGRVESRLRLPRFSAHCAQLLLRPTLSSTPCQHLHGETEGRPGPGPGPGAAPAAAAARARFSGSTPACRAPPDPGSRADLLGEPHPIAAPGTRLASAAVGGPSPHPSSSQEDLLSRAPNGSTPPSRWSPSVTDDIASASGWSDSGGAAWTPDLSGFLRMTPAPAPGPLERQNQASPSARGSR